MSAYDSGNSGKRSLTQDLWSATRYYLSNRTGMIATAAVVVGAGVWFNWGWLVAAGLAPIILLLLPCAAMCALGLCMKGGATSPGDAQVPQRDSAREAGQSPTLRLAATDGKAEPAGETKEQDKVTSRNHKGCC